MEEFYSTNYLLDKMLKSEIFGQHEKNLLSNFHDRVAIWLQRIVSSEPLLLQLRDSLRGYGERIVSYSDISALQTIYQDVVDEIKVNFIKTYIYQDMLFLNVDIIGGKEVFAKR
jgi:hypothetical protein